MIYKQQQKINMRSFIESNSYLQYTMNVYQKGAVFTHYVA